MLQYVSVYFLPLYPSHLSLILLPPPLTWCLNFVLYILMSRLFLSLLLVQLRLVGYWNCPLPLQMYPLYWSGRYWQRLSAGPSLKIDQKYDCMLGGTVHPTSHYLLEEILNYLQLTYLIVQGSLHSRHPDFHPDSWHFVTALLVPTLSSPVLTL